MLFKVGDRVFYVDNGEKDTGTVTAVNPLSLYPYQVEWDGDAPDDSEKVDWFQERQLGQVVGVQ